jgi:hypothetical protein
MSLVYLGKGSGLDSLFSFSSLCDQYAESVSSSHVDSWSANELVDKLSASEEGDLI